MYTDDHLPKELGVIIIHLLSFLVLKIHFLFTWQIAMSILWLPRHAFLYPISRVVQSLVKLDYLVEEEEAKHMVRER